MKKNGVFFLFIGAAMAVDQAVKLLVSKSVDLYDTVTVIPGLFNITRIHNKGAIFGFFSHTGNPIVFVVLTAASFLALALVGFYFFKTPPTDRLMKIALSLILAGALGNLLDRLFRGYVIDFLDLHIGGAHWPFFNVADSCISVGAVLMLVIFFRRKPECSQPS